MNPLLVELCSGLPLQPLPPNRGRNSSLPHAPVRTPNLTLDDEKVALRNALRYFPSNLHSLLAPEFATELREFGHIYMYRFCPQIDMRAYPISQYPCKTKAAAAIMHMIMNNLDSHVAQFPQELVTYGGNGQVFSNWAQFRLVMYYLSQMTEQQTLVMYSGHPQGLFPSPRNAPRVVLTNGMVIPNYSSRDEYEKLFAMGVTMYGQMTAGSYCYIGPQGIVHGTVLIVVKFPSAVVKPDELLSLSCSLMVTGGSWAHLCYHCHTADDRSCFCLGPTHPAESRGHKHFATEIFQPQVTSARVHHSQLQNTNMVVGSQARILYSDQKGRVKIAVAINRAIAAGKITAPVVISRDHHDVSGTDSPFRETSNIYDGSAFCADMAVQNAIGDSFRGATWVALHNGGGVGWGEVVNGGFGLVLDGSVEAEERAKMMLNWDVSNGVSRRCWSGNARAYETICRTMKEHRGLRVTLPHAVEDEEILDRALQE
ncbi:urocanate hydratase [Chiloscyllium plagiosum]|uniref:urocanate hydratase n=1 Tax=Chiloscyllium plagiosum TaxID=36176 RepID=UPI001CB7D062|nr:urocanate hydratase [Chiloscyllium plagiosum]